LSFLGAFGVLGWGREYQTGPGARQRTIVIVIRVQRELLDRGVELGEVGDLDLDRWRECGRRVFGTGRPLLMGIRRILSRSWI
jgi:hypothetical protein